MSRRKGRAGEGPGAPRSVAEMLFAFSLGPCAGCGRFELGEHDFRVGGQVRVYHGPCATCGHLREVKFVVDRFFSKRPAPPPLELGGPEPSRIIAPTAFLAELARLMPLVDREPERLAPAAWRKNARMVNRALICLNELRKFSPEEGEASSLPMPPDTDALPSLQTRIAADAPRVIALEEAASPPEIGRGGFSRVSLSLHRQWVERGRTGEGRLDLAHLHAPAIKIGAQELSGMRMEGGVLDGADFSFARVVDAELTDVSLKRSDLRSIHAQGARLVRCDLGHAWVGRGKCEGVTISGGTFDGAHLDLCNLSRGSFTDVSFRDVDFGNTAFDEAVFVGCDLRGAKLSLHQAGVLGTTTRTRFERCDLRDTTWEGRDLEGTLFLDCKVHGLTGTPARLEGLTLERPDLSPLGDGTAIGRGRELLALWRAHVPVVPVPLSEPGSTTSR